MNNQSNNTPPFGLFSATALVVASMIGAGVFTISGYSLAALGSPRWVLLVWGVGGLVAVAGAISYGALARSLSESGGEYVYLARRVHPLAGFLAGWVSLLAGFTGALAFAASAFEQYAAPLLGIDQPAGRVAIAMIVLCALLHMLHVEGGAWLQNVVVAAKITGLVVLAVAGLWWLARREPLPLASLTTLRVLAPDYWTIATQLTWIYLGYSGFNAAVYVAEEVRDAERTVPRAMLFGTLLVVVLYLALNMVFVYAGPIDQLAGEADIAAVAIELLGGPIAGTCCRVLICVALATSISALTLSGPRVYAKMAADGLFPLPANVVGKSPRAAIALQAVLAAVVALFATLQQQLDYLGFILMLSAAVAVASLFWVKPSDPQQRPNFWQLLAAAFFVGTAAVLATLTAQRNLESCAIAGVVTLATGVATYYALRSCKA